MGLQDRISRQLVAAWAIAKKDIAIYYLRPGTIMGGVLFPLFMFLAFTAGKLSSPAVLIPGLLSITTLFSASSIEPVSIPICLLYTSDAADDLLCVDLGGRRIIKK